MKQRPEMLTITLHWQDKGGEQAATVVCEDGPPAQLIPLLMRGCGLCDDAAAGERRDFSLLAGGLGGQLLFPDKPVSAQGVSSGAHLWLVTGRRAAQPRWLLGLPDGSELLLPSGGVELRRDWLLQALALLNPELYLQELIRLQRRESLYRYVSSRPHCRIALGVSRASVSTERNDVATFLNGVALRAGASSVLRNGDLLTLGAGGLPLILTQLVAIGAISNHCNLEGPGPSNTPYDRSL